MQGLHDLKKCKILYANGCFTVNLLKTNPEKSNHFTNSTQKIQINIEGMAISNSKCEKLLSIHIANKLTFKPHVRSLCKKAGQKLNAFARIACSLKFDLRKLLLNTFIASQFSYATVVWMFRNLKLNNNINSIHEKALIIIYKTIIQRFKNFLQKTVPSKLMTVIYRDYLLKYWKLKWSLLPKTWMKFLTLNNLHILWEMNWDLSHEIFVL